MWLFLTPIHATRSRETAHAQCAITAVYTWKMQTWLDIGDLHQNVWVTETVRKKVSTDHNETNDHVTDNAT